MCIILYMSNIHNLVNKDKEMLKTFVIKRNGNKEAVSFDKVNWRIQNLCNDLTKIDPIPIAQKVIAQIYNGVHTYELDELAASICASLTTENLEYGELAKRIIISNNHKNTSPSFSETVSMLYNNKPAIVSKELYDFVFANKEKFNNYIDYQRDYLFDYFGYKTLEKGYLKKIDNTIIERPQHMIMRVAIGLNIGDIKMSLETYDCISQKYYTVATPGLFHLGTPRSQGISCFSHNTEVFTLNRGVVCISEIMIGDIVTTHTGKAQKVTQIHKNELGDRRMFELCVYRNKPIKVTENHRFYCLKNKTSKTPEWIRVDEMTNDTYIMIPNNVINKENKNVIDLYEYKNLITNKINKEYIITNDENRIYISTKWHHNNLNDNSCKRYLTLNNDFYFLLGYFLGNGHIINKKTINKENIITGIGFTLNSDDIKIIDKITKICEEVFELNICTHKMKNQNTYQILVNSILIGEFFNNICGKHFNKKHLPEFVYNINKEYIYNLFAGLISSDGCISKSRAITITFSNKKLINDLYHLSRNYQIESSISSVKKIPKLGTTIPYTLHLMYNNEIIKLVVKNYKDNRIENMINYYNKQNVNKNNNQFTPININGNKFLKVKLLKELDTNDIDEYRYVYTLGVENDHSYNVEGLICENCFLLGTEDSIEGMYKTISDCAQISKWAGGIGVHISNIRSQGMLIRGTNGYSDGIIPLLRVYNDTAKHVNQCFVGETIVYTNNGAMEIQNVNKGMEVLTRDGTWKHINHVFKNKFNDKLISYKHDAIFEPIRCTKIHQIYVLKNNTQMTPTNLLWNYRGKTILPAFINAENIMINDYVGYPMQNILNKNYEHTETKLSQDNDLYYLYGCLMSYGNLKESYTRTLTSLRKYTITLDPTLEHHRIKIENIKLILTSKGLPYQNYYENEKYVIYWKRCVNEEWDIPPEYVYNNGIKRIHAHLINNSVGMDKIYSFISGLLDTNMQLKTVSKLVAQEFVQLFIQIGILVECKKHCVLDNDRIYRERNVPNQCVYEINVPWDKKLTHIVDFVEYTSKTDFTDNIDDLQYFIHENIIWLPVRDVFVENEIYYGNVYDLNIHRNHNYTIGGGLVHNSGKRPGAFAMYLEPHHPEIMEFLELKKNEGDQDARCRDLFLALWISDYFMHCVEHDLDWSLLDADMCQGLTDTYGDEYIELYKKYVNEGKVKRTLKARDIWNKIVDSQIETGVPYILFKDSINKKSNQKHYGIIRSSNLCAEITLYSDSKEYACCVLSSLCLPRFVDLKSFSFNHEKLLDVIRVAIHNLNRIIDINFYPVKETRISNEKHRPLGLGVQGLADVFMLLNMPFDSDEAKQLNKDIFETIYYGALKASCDIAKQYGTYETYEGSPISQGIFQFDMWGVKPSEKWDWDGLRRDIKQWGVRNSTLIALMPTASTSQIMGNNEAFEPYTSNIYARRTIAGDFVIVNQHLVKQLEEIGLWNKELKDIIIKANGSIQNIDGIPQKIKDVFKTVWEIKQKDIMDMATDRAAYVCQTQSLNLFFEEPTRNMLTKALFYGWKRGLKTGSYYIRSRPRVQAQQFTIAPSNTNTNNKNKTKEELVLACSRENPGACEMCSS